MKKIERPFWGIIFPCVIFFSLIFGYFSGYRINLTDSLPYYVFRIIPLQPDEEIKHNDYVFFKPTLISHDVIPVAIERTYINHRHPMVKKVVGLPGDMIILKDERLFINNTSTPLFILREDSQNRPLSPYLTPLILDEDFYWLSSDPERGFDSRYFGPLHRSFFTHRAFPIF